jgi:hypothetical protein
MKWGHWSLRDGIVAAKRLGIQLRRHGVIHIGWRETGYFTSQCPMPNAAAQRHHANKRGFSC